MPDIHCLMFRVEEEKVYETGDPQIYEAYGGLRDRIKELGFVYLQAEEGYIFSATALSFHLCIFSYVIFPGRYPGRIE